MSGVGLIYSYRDLDASPALARLSENFKDLTELMDALGAEIEDQTVERFTTNIAPDDSPWLPSRRVEQAGGAAKTLVDRAHLRDSITRESNTRSTEIGSNIVYAAIHQFGGEAGRGQSVKLPARPYLGISEDNERELGLIVRDYYELAFGGSFG